MEDPNGRRLMPVQFLHPADGHTADDNGMVDLTPNSGTLVRMLLAGARLIWSCDMPVIRTLLGIGAIEVAPGYEGERYKYVLVDPAWTLRDLFELWQDTRFVPGSLEASDQYIRMRSACRIPGHEMPCEKQLDAAFAVQRETGHYSRVSLLMHFPITQAVAPRIHQEMRTRLQRLRLQSPDLTDVDGLSHEELKMLVPALEKLRESYFAEKDWRDYREPSERSRKLLWSLGAYRTVGCIFAYAVLGTTRRDETVQGYIGQLARFEGLACEVMPHFDMSNPDMVGRALNYVAFSNRLNGRIGKLARYNMCQAVRVILNRTRKFCLSKLSGELVRAAAPVEHPLDRRFLARLRHHYSKLRPAMRAKRKGRTDAIARRYDEVVDGAAFRAQQIARDGQAGRAAIDFMLKPENMGSAFRQFEVEDDELDVRGLPTGHKLTKTWRCWRTEMAWESMRKEHASVRENGHSIHYRKQDVEGRRTAPMPFVFELVEVYRDDGEAPQLPWYIELSDALFLTSPRNMTIDQRRRRHDLCRRLKLPDYIGTAAGLLNFERDRSTLARLALEVHGRRFFPLEEFDHAMMLAAHGLDTVVQTWGRPHEVLQQTAYQQDWERPEEERNGIDPESDRGYFVFRKVSLRDPDPEKPTFVECSDSLYVSAMRIVALMVRRWFRDGIIPTSKPTTAKWKLTPQPWIFSTQAGQLDAQGLTHFLRILLAGIADATLHDFRHASSHRANKARTILTLIKAGLGQRSERLARYYSRLCLEDRRDRRRENANRRRIENAELRARALSMEKLAA